MSSCVCTCMCVYVCMPILTALIILSYCLTAFVQKDTVRNAEKVNFVLILGHRFMLRFIHHRKEI